MDGYNKNADGGKFVTYDRLRAMGTNGFQEPAVDFKDGKIVGTQAAVRRRQVQSRRQGQVHGHAVAWAAGPRQSKRRRISSRS